MLSCTTSFSRPAGSFWVTDKIWRFGPIPWGDQATWRHHCVSRIISIALNQYIDSLVIDNACEVIAVHEKESIRFPLRGWRPSLILSLHDDGDYETMAFPLLRQLIRERNLPVPSLKAWISLVCRKRKQNFWVRDPSGTYSFFLRYRCYIITNSMVFLFLRFKLSIT